MKQPRRWKRCLSIQILSPMNSKNLPRFASSRSALVILTLVLSFFITNLLTAQQSQMPWTINPAFGTTNKAWDVERDAAYNVNVHGGFNPTAVKHMTSAGLLMWTYNTGYNNYVGDMCVDSVGNIYVTGAYPARIAKINTAGVALYNTAGVNGVAYWAITASCSKGAIVVGVSDSTKGGYLAYVNPSTGALVSQTLISSPKQDIRAICSSANGNYYVLTSDAGSNERCIGVDKNFNVLFNVPSRHNPSYMNTPLYSPSTQGYNGIAADLMFVYTTSGDSIFKRDMFTGALLAKAGVVSGSKDANSGVWVDACGNIHVGNSFGFVKFNPSLAQIGVFTTGNVVYDVSGEMVNNEVLSCGNTFVSSMPANACASVTCNGGTSAIVEPVKEGIRIYPNPSTGQFTIALPAGEKSVQVYDMLGNLVEEQTLNASQIQMGNKAYAKGIYLVRVIKGTEIFTEKLVVE